MVNVDGIVPCMAFMTLKDFQLKHIKDISIKIHFEKCVF